MFRPWRRPLSRLETSSALASRCGDGRSGCLDLPLATLADWEPGAPVRDPRGRGAEPTGQVRHLAGSGGEGPRPRPAAIRQRAGSGDGARRPRERRGSGRVKAAGRLVGWDCCSRALDADASIPPNRGGLFRLGYSMTARAQPTASRRLEDLVHLVTFRYGHVRLCHQPPPSDSSSSA